MTAIAVQTTAVSDLPEQTSYWADVRRRFFRNKLAIGGLSVLVFMVLVAIIGPFVFRGNYRFPVADQQLLRVGTKGHLLGTDDQGRDILRRLVRGIRISLLLSVTVTLLSTALGMLFGGIAGYVGGLTDTIISRVIDVTYAVPYIIIGVAFVTIFGRSFWVIMGILLFTGWVGVARLFRAAVLQVRSQDYIEAARSTGASTKRIIMQHVVPNALPPILVSVAFSIAAIVSTESVFAFLGIGFQEPEPSLGVMLGSARGQFQSAPHLLLVPATALMLITLSVVLAGDGLRDALDPKQRGAA